MRLLDDNGFALALTAGLATLTWITPANADGAYGRLGGDVSLQGAVGASFGHGPAVGVSASALYLVTAGPYASADIALSDDARWAHLGNGRLRSLSTGVELRPLFVPRFLKAAESGRAFWDLVLDSIGFRLGARFHPGSEARSLELGGLLDVPLGTTFSGAFLGLSVTKTVPGRALAGLRDNPEETLFFGVALGVRGMLTTHLVDFGDAALRR